MRIHQVIQDLGYSPHEAEVYLTVLKIGEGNLADISRATHLPRSSVKEILGKLRSHSLIVRFLKKKTYHWSAVSPDNLLASVEGKAGLLKKILPELKAMRRSQSPKPHVGIYNGVKEIHQIYDDIIQAKHPILAMVPWQKWIPIFGEEYMDDFMQRRREHFLRINFLTCDNPLAHQLKRKDADMLRITKFLPEGMELSDALYIYGGKVAIITLSAPPVGIMIDDPSVADSVRILFEAYWQRNAGV